MVVRTDHPTATAAVRGTLELLASSLPTRAFDLPAERSELVRACAAYGVTTPPPDGRAADGVDSSHPYVHFDPDLCISCGRCVRMCDEVQGTFALTLAGRGADTVLAPGRRSVDRLGLRRLRRLRRLLPHRGALRDRFS